MCTKTNALAASITQLKMLLIRTKELCSCTSLTVPGYHDQMLFHIYHFVIFNFPLN